MFKTALFVLTEPLHHVRNSLPIYMSEINKLVSKTAYIHLQPTSTQSAFPDVSRSINTNCDNSDSGVGDNRFEILRLPFTTEMRDLVKEIYVSNANTCSDLDIRVLVGHVSNSRLKFKKFNFKDPCDVVFFYKKIEDEEKSKLMKSIGDIFNVSSTNVCQSFSVKGNTGHKASDGEEGSPKKQRLDNSANGKSSRSQDLKQFPHTVLGGTFDRLHIGHKILLSEGCMLGTDKLTVGVTDGEMNKKKTLLELIQPTNERISIVEDFLRDVKPSMVYEVVPITDGFGPTVTDPNMDLIVLSQETKKGGEMINEEREKRGMKRLEEYTIELVEDSCHNRYEESKISSSSQRKRLLGTLHHPLKPKDGLPSTPYIIGLTGGIASGKSSVCKRLEGQGAKIVDCDKLGHRAYIKGTPGYEKVVATFGEQVIGDDGEIDRRELGRIVFGDKVIKDKGVDSLGEEIARFVIFKSTFSLMQSRQTELKRLNAVVWPEIAQLAQEQIQQYAKDGHEVVVLDAAVLLEASWDNMCHEVWTTIVPQEEAVKRMMDRNKLTEDQARQRLNSQISNIERVDNSNVVLCTLWEYEYTQQQVEFAWAKLQQRIHPSSTTTTTAKTKSNM